MPQANSNIRWKIFYLLRYYKLKVETADFSISFKINSKFSEVPTTDTQLAKLFNSTFIEMYDDKFWICHNFNCVKSIYG